MDMTTLISRFGLAVTAFVIARLVLGSVTVRDKRPTVLVCNQPLRLTQPPTLRGVKNE